MIIRPEVSSDFEEITRITREAFQGHPFSEQNEHRIVIALRESGALFISLVAEVEKHVVGHIAFSPVTIDNQKCGWFGLGPLSVEPKYQGKGIGSALVRNGIRDLQESGANGCVLVGDPAYYNRFGFVAQKNLSIPDIPPENFLVLSFVQPMPEGVVDFHPAFWI